MKLTLIILLLAGGILLTALSLWKKAFLLQITGVALIILAGILFLPTFWMTAGLLLAGGGFLLMTLAERKGVLSRLVISFFLLLAGIIIVCTVILTPAGSGTKELENLLKYDNVQAECLGDFVKRNYPGKTVGIVLSGFNSTEESKKEQEDFVRSFEKGFGKAATKSATLPDPASIKYSNTETTAAGEEQRRLQRGQFYSASTYDDIIAQTGCDVVLNLAGFPPDKEEMPQLACLRDTERVLILPCNESNHTQYLREAIRSGVVGALVIFNIDASPLKKDLPENREQAFRTRFLMLTKENIDAVADLPEYKSRLNPPPEEGESFH